MSTAHSAYRQQHAHSWTRVDMLIALYEAGLRHVDSLIEADAANDADAVANYRTKATRIVLQLMAGLDPSHGELPQRVEQLCEFMQYALLTGQSDDFRTVRQTMATLKSAFDEIREQAVQEEEDGLIPPIELTSSVRFTA